MSVLSQTQYFYSKFNLENGWNDEFIISIFGVKYSEEKVDFFKRFFGCVLGEKFCNKMTENYIKSPLLSMRESIEEFNKQNPDKKVNPNTALSQINYCSGKIREIFKDEDMLNNIWNSQKGIEEKYNKQLNEFILQYGTKGRQRKDIEINIPAYKRSGQVSDEEFMNFLKLIQPYTKVFMRKVQKEINSKVNEVGYFNYISQPDMSLTAEEQKHKELIEKLLNGELVFEEHAEKVEEPKADKEYKSETKSEPEKEFVPDFSEEEDDEMIDFSTKSVDSSVAKKNKSNEEQQPVDKKPVEKKPDIYQKTWQTEYGKTNRLQF